MSHTGLCRAMMGTVVNVPLPSRGTSNQVAVTVAQENVLLAIAAGEALYVSHSGPIVGTESPLLIVFFFAPQDPTGPPLPPEVLSVCVPPGLYRFVMPFSIKGVRLGCFAAGGLLVTLWPESMVPRLSAEPAVGLD